MLDIMILYTIYEYEFSMYLILKRIYDVFGDFSKPSFGALKPALVKMEKSNYVNSRKTFSDGGKLTVHYSITSEGKKFLKQKLFDNLSDNPVQFKSNCAIKIIASEIFSKDVQKNILEGLSRQIELKKIEAENKLNINTKLSGFQKIMISNLIVEYTNYLKITENLGA